VFAAYEKFALDLATLNKVVAPRIKVDRMPKDLSMMGAMAIPTKAQMKSPYAAKMQEFQKKIVPKEVRALLAPAVQREMDKGLGRILVDPSAAKTITPNARPGIQKGVQSYTKVHEALERSGSVRPGSLHGSPKTFAQDFNLRNTMTGRGADEFRAALAPLRDPEDAHLKKQLVKTFKDPRAAQFMEPGRRIPGAMKRQLDKRELPMSPAAAKDIMSTQAAHLLKPAVHTTGEATPAEAAEMFGDSPWPSNAELMEINNRFEREGRKRKRFP
jgi:hypothetical protein